MDEFKPRNSFLEPEILRRLAELDLRMANLEMVNTPIDEMVFSRMRTIVNLLQPKVANTSLFRIGANGDGGYLITDIPQNSNVLSLGVGDNISADLELINKNNSSIFAFDPFVDRPDDAPNAFQFFQIGYSPAKVSNFESFTLTEMLSIIQTTPQLALIDIEGAEWTLTSEIVELTRIPQLVFEFHNLTEILNSEVYISILSLLEGLAETHHSVHVHANNAGHTFRFNGFTWPDILEVTFLTKAAFQAENPDLNFGPFPTLFDYPNSNLRTDINLDSIFGVNSMFRIPR